jgi:hypothetical protein
MSFHIRNEQIVYFYIVYGKIWIYSSSFELGCDVLRAMGIQFRRTHKRVEKKGLSETFGERKGIVCEYAQNGAVSAKSASGGKSPSRRNCERS